MHDIWPWLLISQGVFNFGTILHMMAAERRLAAIEKRLGSGSAPGSAQRE